MMTDFIYFAHEHGLIIDNVIADGKIHRVPLINSKKGRLDGSYCLYNDQYGVCGWIHNFKTGEYCKFSKKVENKEISIKLHQSIEKRNIERKKMYDATSQTAEYLIKKIFKLNIHHPYLTDKQVKAHGTYVDKYGALIIPLKNIEGKIRSFQRIERDGKKSFLKNSEIKGCFFKFGTESDIAFVCEGYATGASLYEATGIKTYAAMSINNIENVVDTLISNYNDLQLIIAGDCDTNGQNIAIKVAEKYNCKCIFPQFNKEELQAGFTDFNDYINIKGKSSAKNIIMSLIDYN